MWIFTKSGMLSVVEHRDSPETLLVRARALEHLKAAFPDYEIWTESGSDYRYRAWIGREAVAEYVAQQVKSVDYDNFKASLTDDRYHDACLSVWCAMMRMQNLPADRAEDQLDMFGRFPQ